MLLQTCEQGVTNAVRYANPKDLHDLAVPNTIQIFTTLEVTQLLWNLRLLPVLL